MALIDKNIIAMSMPKAMNRGNAIPLDASSVWYTYAEMAEYAKNGAVAYVGQVLSLVDTENNNEVTAYVIADEAGTLKEVGSVTVDGDNKTIVLDEATGALALKNWGVEYYKWVEAVGEEGQDDYVAAHHEKHVLEEGETWPAGLEPKAATATDGTVVLAWYQPSTTTIEGVSSAIASVQNTVANLAEGIGSREDAAGAETVYGAINKVEEDNAANAEAIKDLQEAQDDYLPVTGGAMTGDLTLADGSKAVSEAAVDAKIAAEIGSAGHLKRAIVESLPSIEEADVETIYMVRDPLAMEGDKYEEFMVIEGEWAQIGDTTIDLTNYIQKVENATEGNLTALDTEGDLTDSGIAAQDVADHLTNTEIHITSEERTAWNEGAALAATNAQAIEDLVKISQDDADKLASLPAIVGIGDNLILENGILSATAEQYELPAATTETIGGIKIGAGLAIDEEGAASVVVKEENGLALTDEGLALALATATTAGAMSAADHTKLANLPDNAQANVIEGVLLGTNEVAAEINENKQLLLSFAATDKPGVVVSTVADNGISVDEITGEMSINNVSVSKLYIANGEELVLYGGTSKY